MNVHEVTFQPVSPSPTPRQIIAGSFLAHNHMAPVGRARIALRLLRGEAILEKPTITQVARLARVSRQLLYQTGGISGRGVKGAAIARAFQRASPAERIAFVRAIGSEELWNVLTNAL